MADTFWEIAEDIDWNVFTYAALDPTGSLKGEVRGCEITLTDIYCGFTAFAWQTKDGPCRITVLDIDLAGNSFADFGDGWFNPNPKAFDGKDLNNFSFDIIDNEGWLNVTAEQMHDLAQLTWTWKDEVRKERFLPELIEKIKKSNLEKGV